MKARTAAGLRYIFIIVPLMLMCAGGFLPDAYGKDADKQLTMTVIGTGEVEEPDPAACRSAAIKNGLAAAVEAAMVTVIPEDILTANFAELDTLFSGSSEAFIVSYSVLSAATPADMENTYCRALVRAVVPRGKIKTTVREAGMLIDIAIPPRLMIAVTQDISGQPPSYWWRADAADIVPAIEKQMAAGFEKRGMETVNHVELMHQETDWEGLSPDLTNEGALELAKALGADFVIVGRVNGSKTGEGNDTDATGSWQGDISVRVLNAVTGREIVARSATVSATQETAYADSAAFFDAAADKAVHLVSPPIVKAWNVQKKRSRALEIEIQGDGYLSKLSAFRKILEAMSLVKTFQMTEMTIDQAIIAAEVEGDAQALADALSGKTSERFRVKVLDVAGTRVTIVLEGPGTSP